MLENVSSLIPLSLQSNASVFLVWSCVNDSQAPAHSVKSQEVRDGTSACYSWRNALESESSPSKPRIHFFLPPHGKQISRWHVVFLDCTYCTRGTEAKSTPWSPGKVATPDHMGKTSVTRVTNTAKNVSLDQIWSHFQPRKHRKWR